MTRLVLQEKLIVAGKTEILKKTVSTIDLLIGLVFIVCVAIFIVIVLFPSPGSPVRFSDETYAISNLRMLSSVQAQYVTRNERYATLDELHNDGSIEWRFAQATTPDKAMSGYFYFLKLGESSWLATAIPAQPGESVKRSFYVDQTGVVRCAPCESADDPPADATSPPLGE